MFTLTAISSTRQQQPFSLELFFVPTSRLNIASCKYALFSGHLCQHLTVQILQLARYRAIRGRGLHFFMAAKTEVTNKLFETGLEVRQLLRRRETAP